MIFQTVFHLIVATAFAQTVVQVGPVKISAEDYKRRYLLSLQSPNPMSPEEFLEEMIRFEVGVQEAEKQKLSEDPLVKERFKQVLYSGLVEKNLQAKVEKISVTDKEMAQYYKRNPEIRLAHILIEVKPGAKPLDRELTRKRALEVLSEVKKSKASFEDLAKTYSQDEATKEYGGDIGFQSRVTILPHIYETALSMKPNEVKGLVETRFGFHILKRLEQRDYDLADKQQVRAAVLEEKRTKLFNEYFDKIKHGYKIDVDKKVLKSLIE